MDYDEALDTVKTILGVNAADLAWSTLNMKQNPEAYIKIRDGVACKILEQLNIKGGKNA